MDVGLNNRNKLGKIAPEFSDVVFFVEATSTEQFNLWQEWSKESRSNIKALSDGDVELIHETLNRYHDPSLYIKVKDLNDKIKHFEQKRVDWKEVSEGFAITIGHIKKHPICVSFNFTFINKKKICFYDCTSRMVDHTMIEDWLISHFQLTHDRYTRWNHVDANNFHNCVNRLDKLDKKPRNTIYKKTKTT